VHADPDLTRGRRWLGYRLLMSLGFSSLTCIPMIVLFSPRACSGMEGSETVAMSALRSCTRAKVLLGDDIEPAWLGSRSGESSYGGVSGTASWAFDVEGSKGRGAFEYEARKRGGNWEVTSATLFVDRETVNIPADCGDGPPAMAPTLPPGAGSGGAPAVVVMPGSPPPAWPVPPAAPPAAPVSSDPQSPDATGACQRLQACCDAAGANGRLEGLCRAVPSLRDTANGDAMCQRFSTSVRVLLALEGRSVPASCN
jgi:hypothetical protein